MSSYSRFDKPKAKAKPAKPAPKPTADPITKGLARGLTAGENAVRGAAGKVKQEFDKDVQAGKDLVGGAKKILNIP